MQTELWNDDVASGSTALLEPPKLVDARTEDEFTRIERAAGEFTTKELVELFSPARFSWKDMDWVVFGWMVAMHVGCLAAPFFFTWSAFGVALLLYWLTGCIGVCLGYHRVLSHKSLKLAKPVEFFVYLCGSLSAQGSPLTWAATHRVHHARSDKEGDPHSPRDGRWWSHVLWLFLPRKRDYERALHAKYVPDLLENPTLRFLERTNNWWMVALGIGLFLVGGWPMLLWGLCVRMVVTYHTTWFVNSVTHLWGYRTYETRDDSKNLWWVALVTWGEGWHNNHHAHPSLARAGHRWWEFDLTWYIIKGLRATGLATNVRDEVPSLGRSSN